MQLFAAAQSVEDLQARRSFAVLCEGDELPDHR